MAEHKHGTMNTEVQEKTFEGFIKYVVRTGAVCLLAICVALFFFG